MNAQRAQDAARICRKPEHSWTNFEEGQVYWWYYHDLEIPTEWQLRYRAERHSYGHNIKWYIFLLKCFPSIDNLDFVKGEFFFDKDKELKFRRVLKGMLNARPLTQAHVDLALRFGSQSIRNKASKILTRQYEI